MRKTKNKNFEAMKYLLLNSKKNIFLDGDISNRSYELINFISSETKKETLNIINNYNINYNKNLIINNNY